MYTDAPDETRLRQGDVIGRFFFPRYSLPNLRLLHELESDGSTKFSEDLQVTAQVGPAVVLTQCCEFTSGKRNAFSLGMLRAISALLRPKVEVWGLNLAELTPVSRSSYRGAKGVTPELVEKLKAANQIDPEQEENDALNVYLYQPDGEVLSEPHLVDFTRVTSVRMKDRHRLVESKVLQLDREHRRQFQVKLGYYYARRAEE